MGGWEGVKSCPPVTRSGVAGGGVLGAGVPWVIMTGDRSGTGDATVRVRDLRKGYVVHEKEPGFLGSLRSFVSRKSRVVEAVRGVSFDLAPGEVVGFLGPNGAGKTTTLKMLSGLLHPSGGEVRVAGFEPGRRENAFLRQITLVMGQKQQLIWDLPALDSFLVNQAIYEIPDAEFRATMAEFTEVLGLEGILKKQVRKLSLGERMKCELAAALLHRPKVLFLDEPTIGLDPQTRFHIWDYVDELRRREQTTMFLTTHYMDEAERCDRIAIIDQGQIVAIDTPTALKASVGADTITLATHDDAVASRELAAEFGISADAKGDHLVLRVPDGEAFVPRIFSTLSVGVTSVNVRRPSLDDVFLKYTGRDLRDADSAGGLAANPMVRAFRSGR